MSFRIVGLSPEPFRHLFGLAESELAAHNAIRCVADEKPGFPDRVELRDADPGETLLLLNFVHQPAATPYRASHAIYVREGALAPYDRIDEVPDALRTRMLSVRAFDAQDMMVDADVVEGGSLESLVERLFENPAVSYLHAHFARRGCYAARIERVVSQEANPDIRSDLSVPLTSSKS
jgi:hypothetical protein